ncbi:hypothetical protein MicB006_2526 [Micromonospora sp. B006]|nr:hypothetical protein MicB006_2526 [Micromonospora sp. B006]
MVRERRPARSGPGHDGRCQVGDRTAASSEPRQRRSTEDRADRRCVPPRGHLIMSIRLIDARHRRKLVSGPSPGPVPPTASRPGLPTMEDRCRPRRDGTS